MQNTKLQTERRSLMRQIRWRWHLEAEARYPDARRAWLACASTLMAGINSMALAQLRVLE